MSGKLKKFILNKGFTEAEMGRMSKQEIADFRHEYNFAKRMGMVD
jgi:hypothetical protein